MSKLLNITITKDRILVRSDDCGPLLSDSSNIVTYDNNLDIVKIDGLSENLQNASNVSRGNTSSKIFSCNPFSMDDFRPDLAALAIHYLVFAICQSAETGITKKPAEWQLDIHGYDNLDKKTKETFEYNTQKYSWINIKKLSINNQTIGIQKYRWAKNAIMLTFVITSALFYMLVISLIRLLGFNSPIDPSEKYSIGNLVFYLLTFYSWGLIYLALGKLLLKSLIPYPIYEDIFIRLSNSPLNLLRLLQQKGTSKTNDA